MLPFGLLLAAVGISVATDPVTRYVHVRYPVPADAPDEVSVRCEVRSGATSAWEPAPVWGYASETALALMEPRDWENGVLRGTVVERRAAGLTRTVVWNPFLSARRTGAARFRLTLSAGRRLLAQHETGVELRNQDVVVLEDWSKVVQQRSISRDPPNGSPFWWVRPGGPLEVRFKGLEVPPLTWPLDLRGAYALFVLLPGRLGGIELRLSGDERAQFFESRGEGRETLWKWTDLTRQHLVIRQPYRTVFLHEDDYLARLRHVRLVPLTAEQAAGLDARYAPLGPKRLVAGYYEPYSWAFYEKIESTLQHWEPLLAFAEARIDMPDVQIGRGGSRFNSETRAGSQLLLDTFGDPVRGVVPRTGNVGRLQQYTNTLATVLRYARALGMRPRANIGATNCYPGTPLEADFSRQHPEWRKGSHLRYEVPEVRRYVLALFEEALETGADALSLDWCRYPNSVTSRETVTGFFRELRSLAGRFEARRGKRITILTRFPARGVPGWEHMDYRTWVRERLVDYLAPSNIQGRHMNFDIGEYVDAVKGARATLLGAVDGLEWGLPLPGMMFARVARMYERGASGIYVYQCDAPLLQSPETRRYISLIGYPEALARWQSRERAGQSRYSKGIYITPPHEVGEYRPWGRLRVWVEGLEPGELEMWLDGRRVNHYQSPPYVLTSEDRSADEAISAGAHRLKIRARDGAGWLEREFDVRFGR